MTHKEYSMGSRELVRGWRPDDSEQLTFVVTQECNLRCKYCYMVDKNDNNIMPFDVAKKAIDYFIKNKDCLFSTEHIVLDFIGGEPLLEIELISRIVDYFKLKSYIEKCDWFGKFRISMSSNGTLYNSEKVQKFIKRNKDLVSIGITIDGIKEKHDLQRIYPNGTGSYEKVENNFKLAMKQGTCAGTKVTISHDDLKYTKESIIHLWNLGIKEIPANIVFEDVWKDNDPEIFQSQLIELVDYIIENKMWSEYNVTFFSDTMGYKIKEDQEMRSICGTGKMFCVDAKGDIYSCVRFMDYSLDNKKSRKYGNIYEGISRDRMRAFKTLYTKYVSDEECRKCRINSACSYCAGYNYDESPNDTLFYRSKSICKMYQAQVRANNYYWARLYNCAGIKRNGGYKDEYNMFFILSDNCVEYCNFDSFDKENFISPETLIEGLEYAFNNFYNPIFVHSNNSIRWLEKILKDNIFGEKLKKSLDKHIVRHICEYSGNIDKDFIYVFSNDINIPNIYNNNTCILNIDQNLLNLLSEKVLALLPYFRRININLKNIDSNFDLSLYENQLKNISNYLLDSIIKGEKKEVRQITDRIFLKEMNNCFSGEKNVTFAPNGKKYICPGFYFSNITSKIDNSQTYLNKAPLCDNCDAFNCNRCIFENYKKTGEINVPSSLQCKIAHIERNIAHSLLTSLHENKLFLEFQFDKADYMDPLEFYDDIIVNDMKVIKNIGGNKNGEKIFM